MSAPDLQTLLTELQRRLAEAHAGGGEKRQAKLREQGKMTARERVAGLLDPGKPSLEIGALAAAGKGVVFIFKPAEGAHSMSIRLRGLDP